MKAATIYRLTIGLIIASLFVFGFAFLPTQARAQENDYAEASPAYSQEELAQMLAPIALYPDALLSQVLMASTYPIEVIEADRWRKRNPNLQDEVLDDALAEQSWDPSVKALCHFPDILALMSERIGETTDLGNAFLAQEEQVMATVQQMRAAAYAQGNLPTNDRQTVVVEKETIIIEPADPRIIYVPYYDPYTIYGTWWYPAYAPYYWGPPGVSIGFGLYYWPGFYFSFTFGNWSYFDWHRNYIHIDIHRRPRYVRHDRWFNRPGRWQHAPVHRRGVAYRDRYTARKYGQAPRAVDYRRDTRGFPQREELNRTGRSIDRTRQEQQRVDRQRVDRQRVDRQRVERTTQTRQRVESDRQRGTVSERTRAETNRSIRTQVERDRQQRDKITSQTRQQRKIKRSQPVTTRSERKQPQKVRVERERATRQPAVRTRAKQQRIEQATPRQRVERQQRQQPRDNAFNRVDQGGKERQSSQRGRASRQVRSSDGRSDRGSSGAERNIRDRSRR